MDKAEIKALCDRVAKGGIFKVGQRVKNTAGLRGTVVEAWANGRYDVDYDDGQTDRGLMSWDLYFLAPGNGEMCVLAI